ncbi:hypothetical protein AJ80_08224 [Polytolypa hystricis UAMH7299]|uniref:Cytochrome P450 n=1 Tax=Polytolypa hystricis (strain UAMH7299) TaxID=1447883 RepID=A0A2B7XBU7_POLH7|nr:hypothetical protein AJ80_08224 [Polytolypa hystricis UAMH7299]
MASPIPQPRGVPLLGNIFDIDQKNTWGSLRKLADKHGPIFKINALGHQIVFIGSAALLEEICDERRFRKCVTGPIVEIRRAVHDSLFTAFHGEESWGIAHRIMAPHVTPVAVQTSVDGIQDCVGDLIRKWTTTTTLEGADGATSTAQRIDVNSDLKRLDLATTLYCFAHQRENFLDDRPEPPMIAAMADATLESMKRPARPKLLTWLLHQRKFDRDIRTMRSFGADIVSSRKYVQTLPERDMLHSLLNDADPQTGKKLTDEQVIDEIINLFIGSATSPCLLAFALWYLIQHPEEIRKAREEIDSVLPEGSSRITTANLKKLVYCEAILREAFRLSAPAPGFNIEPIPAEDSASAAEKEEPIMLAGGKYAIPRNQAMIAILSAVNRDPEVFEDPESFKPERMLGEKYDRLPSAVKKGFGNGKRQCFGYLFAWQCCLIVLVEIIRKVDLKFEEGVGGEMDINGAFCVEPLGFLARVSARAE